MDKAVTKAVATRLLSVVVGLLVMLHVTLSAPPAEASKSAPLLVYDVGTGEVLLANEAGQPWNTASLTKLMTTYLTFDALQKGKLTLKGCSS